MTKVINCLENCAGFCCENHKDFRILFDFTPIEAAMMRQAGTNLIPAPQNQGGYSMDKDCVFLIKQKEKKICDLHGTEQQPGCCQDNRAGDALCVGVRKHVLNGKRFSEVE